MLKIAYVCVIALYQGPLAQGSPNKVVLATLILLSINFYVLAFATFNYILQFFSGHI